MINNSDGTVSFVDVTEYEQVGSVLGQAQINAICAAVNGLTDSVSDAFSEEKNYAVGDYAIYENTLYRFTAEKTAGAWDPTAAEAVTVAGELDKLNGNMTAVSGEVAEKVGKTSNTYTGSQTVRKTVSITHNQYRNAHFVIRNGNNQYSRACIGFENEGVTGGMLFLDNDGRLKYFDNNTDKTYVITWQ